MQGCVSNLAGPVLLVLVALAGCSPSGPVSHDSLRLVAPEPSDGADPFPNWPLHPDRALEMMQTLAVEEISVEGAGAGTTGAMKVDVRYHLDSAEAEFYVKGKRVPPRLDGINNAPRKELAAWELQRLFLDPTDYVVPATTILCEPLSHYEGLDGGEAIPTVPGTSCIMFVLAVWLDDVTVADVFYDEQRFLREPLYAYYLANYNIFAYVINNRDNRTGNVLVAKDDDNRRVFAIDNGVSFGTAWFNWFWPATYRWRQIRVPALPRRTIDRLRELDRDDVDRLAVVLQLEADDDGVLQAAEPGPPIDPDEGVRVQGTTVQFGLTDDEIDDVWERLEDLLEDVDDGEIRLF